MKKNLVLAMLLSIFIPINVYSIDNNFAEKMIYELFDSHINNRNRSFDENYFLMNMPRVENYGIRTKEKLKSLNKETLIDTKLTSKDVEIFKTITIFKNDSITHKSSDILEYSYNPYLVAGEEESITIYDLNLLGLKNNIKKDAKEIKNFCMKIFKRYNKDEKKFEYKDLKDIEEYEVSVMLGAFICIYIRYDKETNNIKNILFSYGS